MFRKRTSARIAIDVVSISVLIALHSSRSLTSLNLIVLQVALSVAHVCYDLLLQEDGKDCSKNQQKEIDLPSFKLEETELLDLACSLGAYTAIVTFANSDFVIAAPCRQLELLVGVPVEGNPLAMFVTGDGSKNLKQALEGLQGDGLSIIQVGEVSIRNPSESSSKELFELHAICIPSSRRVAGDNKCVFYLTRKRLLGAELGSNSNDEDSSTVVSDPVFVEDVTKQQSASTFGQVIELLDVLDLAFVIFNHPRDANEKAWNKNVWANRFALTETRRPSLEAFVDSGQQEWQNSSAAVRQRSAEVHETVQVRRKVFTQMRVMFSTGERSSFVFTSQMPLKVPILGEPEAQQIFALNVVFAWIDEIGRSPRVGEPEPMERLPLLDPVRLAPTNSLTGFGVAVLDCRYANSTAVVWASRPMLAMRGFSSLEEWQMSDAELHRQNAFLQSERVSLQTLVQLERRKLVSLKVRSCASTTNWMPGIAVVAHLPIRWERNGVATVVMLQVEVPLDGSDDTSGDTATNVRLQAHSMTHAASAVVVYDGVGEKLVARNPMAAKLKVPHTLSHIFKYSPSLLAQMRAFFDEKSTSEPWGPHCIPFDDQRWFEVSVALVLSPLHSGSAQVFVATLLDVTATRSRERAFLSAVNALVDATFDARIWITPARNRIPVIAAGPKADYFFQVAGLAGCNLLDHVAVEDHGRLVDYVAQINYLSTDGGHSAQRIQVCILRAGIMIQVDVCGVCFGHGEICLAISEAIAAEIDVDTKSLLGELNRQLSPVGEPSRQNQVRRRSVASVVFPTDSVSQVGERRPNNRAAQEAVPSSYEFG